MLADILASGLEWYDRLQVFAQDDLFERYIPQPGTTSRIDTIAGVFMVVSVIGAGAAILAKIVL